MKPRKNLIHPDKLRKLKLFYKMNKGKTIDPKLRKSVFGDPGESVKNLKNKLAFEK
jgi:hypothetical protein